MTTADVSPGSGHTEVGVWQPLEIALQAASDHENPFVTVEVYADLVGPGFTRRVYGFWNGGRDFVIRLCAPSVGAWSYSTGSNTSDPGLNSVEGRFDARPWSADELTENPNRRGAVKVTTDKRGLEYGDGTPFFLIGDTWWSVPTFRFPLPGDDTVRPPGPDADLRDYLLFRKDQGFNTVAMMAAMPMWADDGHPANIEEPDGTTVRNAWRAPSGSAMAMHNEGGRPFLTPGPVAGLEEVIPDLDRINPEFFKILDKKMDLIFDTGLVSFLEVARRDTGPVWKKYFDWPESYARYIHYVFCRYHAHNVILSPIHFDYYGRTIPSRDYNEPCNLVVDRWGTLPFGTLQSANAGPSTLVNFGGPDECRWLDVHQIGNSREHYAYWYLTEQFHAEPTRPAFNGEPYYSGLDALGEAYRYGKPGNTPGDDMYVRSGMYGSLLSGGYAGFIYGCEGIWQSAVEEGSELFMWDAFRWSSAETVRHLKTFAFVKGTDFRNLTPDAELLVPNRDGDPMAYERWCYCAAAPNKDWFLIYFEANCARDIRLRGVQAQHTPYRLSWFDPRTGTWERPLEPIEVDPNSMLPLPARPDPALDWGLLVERA